MTGFFVRIKRDNKWQSIEIDKLTSEELDEFAESQPNRGWAWAKGLIKWINKNVKEGEGV